MKTKSFSFIFTPEYFPVEDSHCTMLGTGPGHDSVSRGDK